jgi:uncharacterized protein (DUF849 family)
MTPLEWHGQLASTGVRTADGQRSMRFSEDTLGMVQAARGPRPHLGGNARTGMEDTLMLRRGVPVASNADLVARLAAIVRASTRGSSVA